jgi:predicted patatin/cPLA2 family phospholipase
MACNSLRVSDTLKVTAGQCYTNENPQILMAKTYGFHKVVRASAVTPYKRQILKVVTIPVTDPGIKRPIIVHSEALPHTNALTSGHT